MLGGYISDLEPGDVFAPVEYVLTAMMASEYMHGIEEGCEWFHSARGPGGRQLRPPTTIHIDKMRILEANCLKERRLSGHQAQDARIHYEYHARQHAIGYVGERFIVSGKIADKYVKRGRIYLVYALEVHTADGRLITTYGDTTVLKYRTAGEGSND